MLHSFDAIKLTGILNGPNEPIAMLDVRHLLLNFRTKDVPWGSPAQELAGDDAHGLAVVWIRPELLQPLDRVLLYALLLAHELQQAAQLAAPRTQVVDQSIHVL